MARITFFENGMGMAFENGEQVSKAQKPWLLVYAEYLKSQGIDPTKQEIILPNGQTAYIFELEDGSYNWSSKFNNKVMAQNG